MISLKAYTNMKIKLRIAVLILMVACSVQSEDCKEPKQVCKSVPKALCYNSVANLCPCTCKTIVPFVKNHVKSNIVKDDYKKHAHHDLLMNPHPVSETSKFSIVSCFEYKTFAWNMSFRFYQSINHFKSI